MRVTSALLARLAPVVALCLLAACAKTLVRTHVAPANVATLDGASAYLKAHLRGGGVYVLSSWRADGSGVISGEGELLDALRLRTDSGRFSFAPDSVALFETNVVRPSPANAALYLMVGVTAAVGVYCATNPKACFGSCPTFYAPTAAGEQTLQAEGFSSSIAPALEATDTDMLYHARATSREFVLRVTNEALETHVIRRMDLLVAEQPAGGRVFATPAGEYRGASSLQPPGACAAPEGDCRAALAAFDGVERFSTTDSADLAAREHIELSFDSVQGDVGLVITARQTLLTTFLIYQALAYLGTDAGHWLASLERGGEAAVNSAAGLARLLGRVDVQVQDGAGEWVVVGTVGETGPLASDTRVVPLPRSAGPLRVRLSMTRGLWRIEQAVLAALGTVVEPRRLAPDVVRRDGIADAAALAALRDSAATLVTLPGDAYEVGYTLPERPQDHELFLEARGYYLEWVRREWLAEQNPRQALRMVTDPAAMLRELAPAYKRGEAESEAIFWRSRYVRQ